MEYLVWFFHEVLYRWFGEIIFGKDFSSKNDKTEWWKKFILYFVILIVMLVLVFLCFRLYYSLKESFFNSK